MDGLFVQFLLDVKEEFERGLSPLNFAPYSRVVFLVSPDDDPNPEMCRRGVFSATPFGHWIIYTTRNSTAAGVWHELGHSYGDKHANCLQSAEPTPAGSSVYRMRTPLRGLQYGDPFDYMGGGGLGCYARNRTPRGIDAFAPEYEMHASPLRKWQNGWLDDSQIRRVLTGRLTTHTIAGISLRPDDNTIKAIEIPRGFRRVGSPAAPRFVARSLFVFYRDNEPLSDAGATVVFATRPELTLGSDMIQFLHRGREPLDPCRNCFCPQNEVGSCIPMPSCPCAPCSRCSSRAGLATAFPCAADDVTQLGRIPGPVKLGVLLPGQTFEDSVSRASIKVLSAANGRLTVEVKSTDGEAFVPHRNIPIVSVTSQKIQTRRFLGDFFGETCLDDITVTAYDPDALARVPTASVLSPRDPRIVTGPVLPQIWDGIRRVTINAFAKGFEMMPGGQRIFDAAEIAGLRRRRVPLSLSSRLIGDPFAALDLSESAISALNPGKPTPFRKIAAISVLVESDSGQTTHAGLVYIYATGKLYPCSG